MPAPRFWAVIPAAGIGSRMAAGIPKQYLSIRGYTVLEHTLSRFCRHSLISGVVAAIAVDDHRWPQLGISAHAKIRRADGGRERVHSVLNGLRALEREAEADDWVLVHDAARPCIRGSDISTLIEKMREHPVGGLLGWPVRDTIKRVGEAEEVLETVDRTGLWHALTPQMFRLGEIKAALEQALAGDMLVTDEAQAMELAGRRPKFIKGAPDNMKITLKSDLELAEIYIRAQETDTACA